MSLAWSFWDGSCYAVLGVHAPGRILVPAIVAALEAAGKTLWLVDGNQAELRGREVHADLAGAPGTFDGALILSAPDRAAAAVEACVRAGITRIWLDTRGNSREAAEIARAAGVPCVAEACPLMTIPGASWPHRFHGRLASWFGRLP